MTFPRKEPVRVGFDEAQRIRYLVENGLASIEQLAKQYGVHPRTVRNIAKGRTYVKARGGENHPQAKATPEDVRRIRSLFDQGTPIYKIMEEFPYFKYEMVRRIAIRATWKHLP